MTAPAPIPAETLAEVERLWAERDGAYQQASNMYSQAVRNADEANTQEARANTAEAALATMTAAHAELCEKVSELQAEVDAWIDKVERLRTIEAAGRAYMDATLQENAHRHNCKAGCDDDGHECAEYGELWVAETYAMTAFWATLKVAAAGQAPAGSGAGE